MPNTFKMLTVILTALWLASSTVLYADEMLPIKIQTALIFKTLGYINNPDKISVNGKIYVGILFDENISHQSYSKDVLAEILNSSSANYRVSDSQIEPVLFKYGTEEIMASALAGRNVKVLYVIVQNKNYLNSILKVTKELKILSITGAYPDDSAKSGVSIVFSVHDKKPAITANAVSLKNEEKEFNKDFYSFARVVE
jgi:hypothetical protein